MTEEQKEKPKRLILKAKKLSLSNSNAESKQDYLLSGRTKTVVVEIKNNKIVSPTIPSMQNSISNDVNLTSDELETRLKAFKDSTRTKKKNTIIKEEEKIKITVEQNEKQDVSTTEDLNKKENVTVEATIEEVITPPKENTENKIIDISDEENKFSKKKQENPNTALKAKQYSERRNKVNLFQLLNSTSGEAKPDKVRSLSSIKRAQKKEKRKLIIQDSAEKVYREVILSESISVSDLANKMSELTKTVIKELMKLGMIANSNQIIDADTAELVATTLGHSVKRIQDESIETILQISPDDKLLKHRPPVVTVMGHVDHGKTSLLDAIKSTNVTNKEFGGITQHIGAYQVFLDEGRSITFLDTPGHEAFTMMRARGAQATDIIILVIAADDGIKAQTIEAISHIKAANLPIIIAINKIDKGTHNLEKIKYDLVSHGIIPDDLGGEVMLIPVSAIKKINIEKLLDSILLLSDIMDLKSVFDTTARGVVLESRIELGKGIVATFLVQQGTLKIGDIVITGGSYGKVKKMMNSKGEDLEIVTPSTPVEILGLNTVPQVGEKFVIVENERKAKEITENYIHKQKIITAKPLAKLNLETLFSTNNKVKELKLIIKADVHGSMEAINSSLLKLNNEEVNIRILHSAVGTVTESDIMLAKASNCIIIAFNVKANNNQVSLLAENEMVKIFYYNIIYNVIDEIKAIILGMMSPILREENLGIAEVKQVFNLTKFGKVAGCYVTKGVIKRGSKVRLIRDGIVVYTGALKALKRFKEDMKEVKEGFECGISIENYSDIKVGDQIEDFVIISEPKKLTY